MVGNLGRASGGSKGKVRPSNQPSPALPSPPFSAVSCILAWHCSLGAGAVFASADGAGTSLCHVAPSLQR